MATPDKEIEILRREFLDAEDAELFKDTLAFSVARCIVDYHDPDLLKQMPDWVGDMVREICQVYLEHGHYTIVSNLGEVDHTPMVAELTRILGITAAPQP
jgi:hypothetical protein